MGLTPDEYFEAFVVGNCEDCRDDPGCLRRALNAAVSAAHLADHYYYYNRRHNPKAVESFQRIGPFIEYLADQTTGCFRDLRDISNAYKHLYTDDENRRVESTIASGGAIVAVRLPSAESDVAQLGSEYDEERGGEERDPSFVQFTRKDGTTGEFLPVLESFVEYWYQTYSFQDT